MARFPVSGGNKPSSTYAEANTIFLALHHAYRILHPNNEYVTHTDSLSSVHGWDRSGRTMSTRAFLADKFAPVWQAVRTLIQDHTETHSHTTIKILWQCTEHGRLWSDPMRWMARVLTHRTVDTAANVATASGRNNEGRYIKIFDVPPCTPPLVLEMAGSVYTAPTEFMRRSLSTHSASRLLRILNNTNTRLVSARGVRFVADGMVHLDATVLLQSKTPSHILDSGLRDALGRHAGTLQNLVSIESSKPIRDRLYLALTGTTAHTPLHCILCDMDTIETITNTLEFALRWYIIVNYASSLWLKPLPP